MKTIYITILISLLTSFLKAQEKSDFMNNKIFIAKVGSICEETTEPDPCAGKQIYLVLKFKQERVLITEKYVSSCDEESIVAIGNYKWELLDTGEVKIYSKPDEIVYTYLENLKVSLKNKQLIGSRKEWNNNLTEYIFVHEPK